MSMSLELLPGIIILIISQAIQKNNLTLMHGVGLKKKGEDEVSALMFNITSLTNTTLYQF